jgi:hypothetical protein
VLHTLGLRYLFITVLLVFTLRPSYGVNGAPKILRACMNYDDSIVTVSWKPVSDACNSFSNYQLYSNQNSGPYSLLATINSIGTVEYPHKLSDLNTTRSYYLVVSSSCDGLSEFNSDTIAIDLTYPDNIGLDSLSVDVNTQQVVAGWRTNPSKDTRGYQLYNFSSGNGDSLGYTQDTFFVVAPNPVNPFPVVIASIDSCNLSSLLSEPHQIMKLGSTVDTCKREIQLNWSSYRGWPAIDSVCLFVNTNNSGFKKDTTLSGNRTSFLFENIILGNTYDFYIRAYYNDITSSSNRSMIVTRELSVPNMLYMSTVTVNEQHVSIPTLIDNETDQDRIIISRGATTDVLTPYDSFKLDKQLEYTFTDNDINVNAERYFYQVECINKCNETVASSNISSNILLSLNEENNLTYNSYTGWYGDVEQYMLENKTFSSTWNNIVSNIQPNPTNADTFTGCYRIKAYETSNSIFNNATSLSNEICFTQPFTVFAPTGINFSTENNRFIIIGYGINHQKSYYSIYNRWGEKIIEKPTNETWDCKLNGEYIQNGLYTYVVTAYSLDNQRKIVSNTLYVIR